MASQASAPVYRTPHPLSTRLFLASKLYFFKFVAKVLMGIRNFPGIKNKDHNPTFTKVYPVQPSLRHRIFVPKSYKTGDPPLPLYLDIHGGGFALFDVRIIRTILCQAIADPPDI
jgi:acetyl esterase/lipase